MLVRVDARHTDLAARALCALTIVALITTISCGRRGPNPREALDAMIQDSPEPYSFRMRYAAAGSRARDCFRRYTRFVADVDQDAGVAIFRETDEAPPLLVVRRGSTAVAARALAADPPLASPWITVATPVADAHREDALTRLLGPELASYAMSGDIPPSGRTTIEDAVARAVAVEELNKRPSTADGTRSFRLAGVSPDADQDAPPFEITTTLTRGGRVAELTVTAGAVGADPDERPGWTIDYQSTAVVSVPAVSSVVSFDDIDVAALRTRPVACELPL